MSIKPVGYRVGDTASLTRTITSEDVEAFARITGDTNPVHLDEQYAATTQFRRRISHGILVAGHISAVLGTVLPGPGSIYLNQSLLFKKPVYLNDTITTIVTITRIREDKPILTFSTLCANQHNETVLEGEAVLLVPKS